MQLFTAQSINQSLLPYKYLFPSPHPQFRIIIAYCEYLLGYVILFPLKFIECIAISAADSHLVLCVYLFLCKRSFNALNKILMFLVCILCDDIKLSVSVHVKWLKSGWSWANSKNIVIVNLLNKNTNMFKKLFDSQLESIHGWLRNKASKKTR